MGRHVDKCIERKAFGKTTENPKASLFHIVVQGRYAPEYWLHLEVVANTKLKNLDSFLRNIWLECCGHLSAFNIGGRRYVSDMAESEYEEKSMNVKIGSVLGPGMSFIHEYDFGTTTELALKVLSDREGEPMNKSIQIMARNNPPLIVCSLCGKAATQVCAQCIYEGKGWLCDKCASEHECGEEMLLPVVNSPRVGMCGYTGDGE